MPKPREVCLCHKTSQAPPVWGPASILLLTVCTTGGMPHTNHLA
jgi:hypothetical protein